jgi:hypothetical protein
MLRILHEETVKKTKEKHNVLARKKKTEKVIMPKEEMPRNKYACLSAPRRKVCAPRERMLAKRK